jgi:3-oxoacyl-[acyl-carrier-protein] synthase III
VTPLLSAPAYELGEYADPVGELPELIGDPETADRLTAPAAGFETYHWSDAAVTELMAVSARRTLLAAELPPAEVDVVILATDSLPHDRSAHTAVAQLLSELGLSQATALTIGLLDCSTAMVAVGTAASYVRDGTASHVLVLSGDVAAQATGGERVVAGGAAIASDAAASVLVSAQVPGLPVLSMAHHTSAELITGDLPPQRQLITRVRGHQELFARLGIGRELRASTVDHVLPSNFARNVVRIYLAELGFAEGQLAQGNVGRIAHCLGSDPLINLADHLVSPRSQPGHLMLLGEGIAHLGAVLTGPRPH